MKKYIFKKRRYVVIVKVIDFLGNLFFKSLNERIDLNSLNKILIVRLDHLGDIVSSIPVYKQVKEKLQECRVSVLTTPKGEEILRGNPFIDQIIVFSCPWFERERKNYGKFFSLRKRILKENFDYALELRGDIRNILLLKFCGVKNVIGYGITGGGFLLSREVTWQGSLHAVDKNLFILKELGLNYSSDSPRIYWNEKEKEFEWANKLLRDERPVVAYHLDAGTKAKRWPQERFIELMNWVEKTFPVRTILIGEKKIPNLSDAGFFSLSGKTTLRQLIHILRLSKLLVTNDSGPAHVASAVGTPVVVIWSGTSDPRIWAPRGAKVKIVRKNVECQFCERRSCSSIKCLKKVEVEDAFSAVKERLEE